MLRNVISLLFVIMVFGSCIASADDSRRQVLHVLNRELPDPVSVTLDWEQLHWLRKKGELRVATWAPDNPPFDFISEPGVYEGIYADYLQLIGNTLGLRVSVLRFTSRTEAMQALQKADVDVVIEDAGISQAENDLFVRTQDLLGNRPVLVTRENNASYSFSPDSVVKLAVADGYQREQDIIQRFPYAEITRFPSNQGALSSVALGKNDYFLGDLTTASFQIERNYSNQLTITGLYPPLEPGARLILRKSDSPLKDSINTVLSVIPDTQRRVISRQWVQQQDIWRFETPLVLTKQEQRWLKNNPTLKVSVDPFYAPFSMIDKNGELRGIAADILRLIHLRTGLNFEIQAVNSVTQMYEQLDAGQADLLAATSFSLEREKHALFPRPWQPTPGVLVVRNDDTAPKVLSNQLTLATVNGNSQAEFLAKKWPGIRWKYAGNESLALQMVSSGKADGAVGSQVSANYLIDRYFEGKLRMAMPLSNMPTMVGFAVRRDAPELLSILNKAQSEILPLEISQIVHKWQGTPDITLDTWRLYNVQFYWLMTGAGVLVTLGLGWGYLRDREKRRIVLTQQKLQDQLVFRDTLLDGSPTPIYVLDTQFTILLHNGAWQNYFRKLPGELLQLSLFDQRHPLAPLREHLSQILLLQQEAQQECVISDGVEERIISHWASPFFDALGDVGGVICGWQDITEHNRLLHELSVEKELAEVANRAKSTFLATMSHEIRTPISAILGLLEMEVHKQPDNDAIHVAYESAQTLMGLIGDVLDMAKIESGQLELAPEWLEVGDILLPIIRVFEEVAKHKNLPVQLERQVEPDTQVFIDGNRLRQAIANYLSNAVKFTREGRIDVRVRSEKMSENSLRLFIEIEDTGPGISSADQQKLFKPFVQLEEGRRQTGTGLGLVISSQLLEKMHGSMQMQSHPGRGTLIQIEVPMSSRKTKKTEEHGAGMKKHLSAPLTVLIVDDHPVNRMVLGRQISLLGHKVTEAESGHEGLNIWRKGHFDLIITDCTMPDMDGFTLTREIRSSGNDITIYGLTANAQSSAREKGVAAGMNECFFKPLRLSQLETILGSVQKPTSLTMLEALIRLPELRSLLHDDDDMLSCILQRTREENECDLKVCWHSFFAMDWEALSNCLHKLGGAAQVIYAEDTDLLCHEARMLCVEPLNASELKLALQELDKNLKTLDHAIMAWLNA